MNATTKVESYKVKTVKKAIADTNGRWFSVTFRKADGSLRTMTARTESYKGMTGTGKPRSAETTDKYELVYCRDADALRSVNYATVQRIKIGDLNITFE